MTPAQIRIVRVSFARIEPVLPQLGERFYERLFTIAPDLRPLFPPDLSVQEGKFMTVIGELVNLHLHSLLSLPAVDGKAALPALTKLGRNHASIGVQAGHFNHVRAALTDVLRQGLGEHFTFEVEGAWMAAFDVLANAMLDGMAQVSAERDRFLNRLGEEQEETPQAPAVTEAPAFQRFFQ